MKFCVKGYSRIYVPKVEHIEKVKKLIQRMDPFEAEYMPKDLITTWAGFIDLVYNGKFEMDPLEIMAACWNMGIFAFFITEEMEYTGYRKEFKLPWERAQRIWNTALEAAQDSPGNLGENDAIAAIQYGYDQFVKSNR